VSRLETNGYYALGVPAYVALGALELWLARRKGVRAYRFADTLGNLSAGLGEVILGLFLGPWLLALYDLGFARIAIVRWPEGSWIPWVLAFVAGDLCYYWYHRAGHTVAALWAIHGVHHQTEQFNLSIAIRHPWLSDVYSAPFYALLPMLGVPPAHFFVAISAISFYALTVHTNLFHRPALYVFVTPATHVVHHAQNRRYLNRNFGAMLNVWDRMFGTYAEVDPADPPRLGTTFGYATHDGARSQWIFFARLLATARQASTLGDRIRTWTKPPGWLPPGARPIAPGRARDDEAIPRATRVYAAISFTLTLALALYVLWMRDAHPFWLLAAASLAILGGLFTLGGLLDGRPACARDELWRLGGTLALGAVLASVPRYAGVGAAVVVAAAGSAVWVAGARRTLDPRGPMLPG
jgi:alkylglycerol monooxygenase